MGIVYPVNPVTTVQPEANRTRRLRTAHPRLGHRTPQRRSAWAAPLLALILLGAFHTSASAAPTLTVNLKDNDVVSDITKVIVQAFSEGGVTKVEFSVDDQLRATLMKAPYEYSWDTVDENEGKHTLLVALFDGEGKTSVRRVKVEVDNGLTLGIKPHADKALELFHKGKFDEAMIEGRKAYKINIADLDAIRALSAGVGGKGDYNRALDLLEKQQRINNQLIGDPKSYPMSDRASMELRGIFRLLRAEKQTTAAAMLADLTTAYDFWRKLIPNYLGDIRAKYPDSNASPAAQFAVGDALFYHGDYEGALERYRRVPANTKEAVSAANRSAMALIRMSRLREAEQIVNSLTASKQANDATAAISGAILLTQHKYAKARAEVEEAAAHKSLTGLMIAAHADLSMANYRRAQEELSQVAERALNVAETQYLASAFLTDGRDLKRATSNLFGALRLDPGLLDTYTLRGYQLAALAPTDGFSQAQVFFDFVLQRDPLHEGARIGKAIVLLNQKKYKPAEQIMKDLTRDDRFSGDVWVVYAGALAGGSEQLPVGEALAQARKTDPERWNDIVVPKLTDLIVRVGRHRRPPLLTPALLSLEESGK